MANWLTRILPPTSNESDNSSSSLPSTIKRAPLISRPTVYSAEPTKLPNASIIYGIAASVLFVVALYFLFTGVWWTGLLVLLPSACFFGFALHFLKHPNW